MSVVKLQERSAYGQRRIYPMNDVARLLAQLTGRKTFSDADIAVIRNLDYEVEYIQLEQETAE